MNSWEAVLLDPLRTILIQISQFLINALLVLIILLIGWLISKVVKAVISKSLKTARFNELSSRIELDKLLNKGGITYTFSELVGIMCYWLCILITFMVAVNSVGLTIAADLLNKVVLYIPNIIAALFILILGMFVSTLLKNIVLTAASNAGISHGKLLSQVVEFVVIAFAIFVGLEQLQIGIRITELTLGIVLGSVGLGLALAFGLGCKELAGKFAAELVDKLKKKE